LLSGDVKVVMFADLGVVDVYEMVDKTLGINSHIKYHYFEIALRVNLKIRTYCYSFNSEEKRVTHLGCFDTISARPYRRKK
jgi:hypothetical protein